MFIGFYGLLFLLIIVSIIVCFIVSLCSFISAIRRNRAYPGTFTKGQIITRMVFMIVSSVLFALLLMVVIGFIVLINMAVAFM